MSQAPQQSQQQAAPSASAPQQAQAQPQPQQPAAPPNKKVPIGPPTDLGNGKKFYMITGQKFEVDTRYDLVKILGYGAYGTVVSATDSATIDPKTKQPTRVAIKKISRVYDDLVDGKRILREIMVLGLIRHPNLLALRRLLKPVSKAAFEDVYVVTDQFDADLHQIIKSPQKLSDEHCQYFMVQAFRGLAYLHSANVMHRDLKPSNLLVNGNCDLVICDFGLARGVDEGELTDYVVTRWYRPPELLTLNTHYSTAVDVWSLALIFGEVLNRRPVLQGRDYISQLALVMDLLGTPCDDDLKTLSDEARRFILAQPRKSKRDFSQIFPTATPEGIDLLDKTLKFNPAQRISAMDALKHPYFRNFFEGTEAHVSEKTFSWELDNEDLTAAQLREGLWREIVKFHPGCEDDAEKTAASLSSTGGTAAAASSGEGGEAKNEEKEKEKDGVAATTDANQTEPQRKTSTSASSASDAKAAAKDDEVPPPPPPPPPATTSSAPPSAAAEPPKGDAASDAKKN